MPRYTIHNKRTGESLGTYEAPNPKAAAVAVRHDAGHPSEEAIIEALCADDIEALNAELEINEDV